MLSSLISIGAVATGFILTAMFINANGFNPVPVNLKLVSEWLTIGSLHVDFNLQIDTLSLMMLLVVTGVGGLIHIYSYGYMDHDRSKARFFAFLSLFTFSMLGIVLSANFVQMFIFWELVGVSSYLLIGFWFEKPSAGDAAKKAFITNRLGDFGFLFGILMVWGLLGSLNFNELSDTMKAHPNLLGNLAQPCDDRIHGEHALWGRDPAPDTGNVGRGRGIASYAVQGPSSPCVEGCTGIGEGIRCHFRASRMNANVSPRICAMIGLKSA